MRKIFNIILLFVTIIAAGSCRRASDNGKIDGFWRIDEINYKASGETVCPSGLFIAVNLELLQLDDPAVKHTGIISYHKGDSRLGDILHEILTSTFHRIYTLDVQKVFIDSSSCL